MKLLYVLGSYFPAQSGGPNNTIHWQAKYLTMKGVDVTVASLKSGLSSEDIFDYNITLNKKNSIEGVKAFYFDYIKNRYFSIKLYYWLFINIKHFDFVQLTSYFFPITWFAACICQIYKIPFSLAPRGELEENALNYSAKIKKVIDKVLLRKLYKKTKFVMVTSIQELDFCKNFFSKDMKFELIPNYIDMSKSSHMETNEILMKKDILYLGRIHPKKGIENLIKAYLKLDESIINRHDLLIVGKGNEYYENSLRDLVNSSNKKDKIKFLGHKQGIEKAELYKSSKVFVLPSYSENFGNVVLESLSFSTPVIASKYTPWEILESYKCGSWIDNKVNEIKEKLEFYLNLNDSEYLEYSNNSFNFVYKQYDICQNINNLLEVYSENRNEKV